jgi:hypothetical protein
MEVRRRVGRAVRCVALLCVVQLIASATLVNALGAEPTVVPTRRILAAGGRTSYVIALDSDATDAETLAASELASYLRRISGASFAIRRGRAGEQLRSTDRAIVLRTEGRDDAHGVAADAYTITVRGESVILTGASPRAVLYAAYDFLARLGCRWLAPELAFYAGAAEYVPHEATLVYESRGDVTERPVFAIRKLDMGEARSHDLESLRRIVEWMPKLRFNTLMVPMGSGASSDRTWDDWRSALTPELKKRGLTIEAGGHGYQRFLAADMENGELFVRHPNWFGKDSTCNVSRSAPVVFNTRNDSAVAYLIHNVARYVTEHPEIDVFDFWPPDGARWDECVKEKSEESVEDRHARLVAALHDTLARVRPRLRLEMIAYAHAKMPPEHVVIPPDVLVDFCPISENFDVPIFDSSDKSNAIYVRAIQAWRRSYPGDIGLYSYYRKYAWRSLPNVIPHLMQQEMRWYAAEPLQGISTYAEPGDWYTYELNHYVLGELAWNPGVDVDSLIDGYALVRYGRSRKLAIAALATLENSFRLRGSIPYSAPDSTAQIARTLAVVGAQRDGVRRAAAAAGNGELAANLERLGLMLEFAERDLAIHKSRNDGGNPEETRALVRELVAFLTVHKTQGVFVVYGGDDFSRYLAHYTRDWNAVGAAAGPGDGE